MQPREDTLNDKTLAFWNVSRSYNGIKGCVPMTVGAAIKKLGDLLDSVSPRHPLRSKILELQDQIIMGSESAPKSNWRR